MKKALNVCIVIIAALTAGCASIDKVMTGGTNSMPSDEERVELVKRFPALTESQRARFIRGEPWVGMTQEQLEACVGDKSAKTQRKISSIGSQEVQLYTVRKGNWKTGIKTVYLRAVMTDGKLAEFSELDGNVGSYDRL